MSHELILAKIETLPEESRRQLLAFLDFLSGQARPSSPSTPAPGFKFDWAGGLADLGKDDTAVELQHKVIEWHSPLASQPTANQVSRHDRR